VVIRRTLPENLVAKFSASLGVPPGEALRRLAAGCTRALPAGTRQPPARALPSGPAASNLDPAPWWTALEQPAVAGQPDSPAKGAPTSQDASISPWRALWDEAWPELLMLGGILLIGWLTGGLNVGPGAAAAQPYSSWRPS